MGHVGLRRATNGATPDRPPMTPADIAQILYRAAEYLEQLLPPKEADTFLTPKEAAEKFNVSTHWLYRHWKDGEFGYRLSPHKVLISEQSLLAYIESTRGAG